jgi:outer membrane protein OmpA-like peptidoglycan-associated protein
MKKLKLAALVVLFGALLSGCAVNPETGEREFNRTAIGATVGGVAGGLLGAAVGGEKGALIGVAAGAAAGGGTGYWMDKRAEKLKAELQGSGMEVQSQVDPATGVQVLTVQAPADIAFASGSAELQSTAFQGLSAVANSVKSQPGLKLKVTGHTDSTGSSQLNSTLSAARAQSVAMYLFSAGVPVDVVTVRGVGPSQPVASNDTVEGRAQNRRVEIQISQG